MPPGRTMQMPDVFYSRLPFGLRIRRKFLLQHGIVSARMLSIGLPARAPCALRRI